MLEDIMEDRKSVVIKDIYEFGNRLIVLYFDDEMRGYDITEDNIIMLLSTPYLSWEAKEHLFFEAKAHNLNTFEVELAYKL